MIEVAFTYDFIPGIDEEAYAQIGRKATQLMVESEGFLEFRAHRNLVGNPHVRRTSVWRNLDDWAKLAQSPEFQEVTAEFRTFVTNLEVQFWGPSPLVPDPVKA